MIGHVTLHTSAKTCGLSGSGGPAASHHYINMEYAPFLVLKRGRPSVAKGARFFAYSKLIIDFKGVPMKLKIIALATSVE